MTVSQLPRRTGDRMSTRSEGKDDSEGKDGGEGKECEGKDAGDASSPKREKFEVVDKVHDYCTSTEFEGAFEEFTKEYSSVILSHSLCFHRPDSCRCFYR